MSTTGKSGRISRRLLLGAILGSAAHQALANAPLTSIRPVPRYGKPLPPPVQSVGDLVADARLSGKVGVAVADATTGEILESHNGTTGLPPASVTKAITALYALEKLGPHHRFRTRLIAAGPIRDGRLEGDLVLVGGNDPTLDTDTLGDMAARMKESGLREVTGSFLVSSGGLPTIPSIDPGQPDQVGYNPAISGLNLNYNRVHFNWKRAGSTYDTGMEARSVRFSPAVAVARMEVIDRSMPVYTYADAGIADTWTVAKGALGKEGSRWLPVRKPLEYAGEVFQTLARTHGIVLSRPKVTQQVPQSTLVTDHQSAPLRDILREMLLYSTNITAEVVGMSASQASGASVVSLKSSAQAMSAWARATLGATQASFVDHSGLGNESRISAQDMVAALVKARTSGVLGPILKTIPMRNSKGEPQPNHPVTVRAKTGTLNFVSALAGYMTRPDGRDLVFAIFTGDLGARAAILADEDETPPGSRAWLGRSRGLQSKLLNRWGTVYSAG